MHKKTSDLRSDVMRMNLGNIPPNSGKYVKSVLEFVLKTCWVLIYSRL